MPLILGTNSIKDTGYEVANSCRFNDDSDDHLDRTPSSSGNRRTWTWSCWFKRASFTSNSRVFVAHSDNSNRVEIGIHNETVNCFRVELLSSSSNSELQTNAVFRDPSAWFHAVVAVDTTQGTDSNRVKLYINGTQVTSFQTESYPTQNTEYVINHTVEHNIGKSINFARPYDGYMCEVVLIDGQQLDPTSFGEFDEDSPTIWKPIDVSGLTFGTNGFYLDFENSSALGNDVSGNDNDFTVNNLTAADQTTDTCTNNFATLNPLGFAGTIPTFSQGNLNVVVDNTASLWSVPTIGVSSGKWYVEGRLEGSTIASGIYYHDIGFADRPDNAGQSLYASDARVFWLSSWDGKINYRTGGSTTAGLVTGLTTIVPGNFFQLYLDMDNELMYWGREGSLLNSTGVSFNGKESLTGEYYFAFADQYTNGTTEYAVNFGQGSFVGSNYGTTSVSNFQDANGFGNFKYNPTVTTDEGSKDFLALCTKNLAEFG